MARFLLIHGSCHGAWCWRDTIPALQALGHEASAIDLPSHGDDRTPPGEVTLDAYARAIVAAAEPGTILVGHSMGGYPITAAAALDPKRFARLIYLCAYVPTTGETLADRRRSAPSQPLMDAVRLAEDRATFTIDPDLAVSKFYHDVDPAAAEWAVAKLCPQPVLPQETVCAATVDLPRSYIRCMDDRTIPPEFQVTMSDGWDDVYEMPTSHSPFLSDPKGLARILSTIAEA